MYLRNIRICLTQLHTSGLIVFSYPPHAMDRNLKTWQSVQCAWSLLIHLIPVQLRMRCLTGLLTSLVLTHHTTMNTSSPLLVTQVRELQGKALGVSHVCDKGCWGDGYTSVMTYFTGKKQIQ